MSISYLIVTLALSNVQHDMIVQQPVFMKDTDELRMVGEIMLASGGNPWAIPVPDADYQRDPRQSQQQPQAQMYQPHYITPEELKSLERMPEERQSSGSNWAPPYRGGVPQTGRYIAPMVGGPGYYGPGGYPLDGIYGRPYYPGSAPLMDPYGGLPYGDLPVEEFLPFMY